MTRTHGRIAGGKFIQRFEQAKQVMAIATGIVEHENFKISSAWYEGGSGGGGGVIRLIKFDESDMGRTYH